MSITAGILKRCLEECEKSTYKYRIGAVIFKGSRILSSGHNSIRSSSISPKYKLYPNSIHAEQAALLGLDWSKLRGYSILTLKISKTKQFLGMAKPCSMCLTLLNTIGIKNIYYSNPIGEIELYRED